MSNGVKVEQSEHGKEPLNRRNLRSKDKSATPNRLSQFDFDNINSLIYQNHAILVEKGADFNNLYKKYEYAQSKMPEGTSLPLNLVRKDRLLPRKLKHAPDPLCDEVYDNFHKRMRKEERMMSSADRLKMLTEVDNLHTSLQLLLQYDWVRHLPTITRINNMKDYAELERKKELTIKEIRRLLERYESWKKRHDLFVSETKEDPEEKPPDYDEYNTPIEKLRSYVRRSMRKRTGAVFKLNLNNGYALVIDPTSRPKIVMVTPKQTKSTSKVEPLTNKAQKIRKVESRNKSNVTQSETNREKPIASLSTLKIKSKNKIQPLDLNDVKRSNLKLTFDQTNDVALGHKILTFEDLSDFQISMGWKRRADEWRSSRKRLRKHIHLHD